MDYITVQRPATAEVVIKKSRFIGHAFPVTSEEDAQARLELLRVEHRDARHNAFAYRLGPKALVQRMSDDGEPQGTAGRPILELLQKQDVTDVLVVVTRYFGGVLLGAPGLVRAYGEAARDALAAAGVERRKELTLLRLTLDYTWLGKVQHWLGEAGAITLDTKFAEQVAITAAVAPEAAEGLLASLAERTAGQLQAETVGTHFVSQPL
ncbi:MAG: YigZ family protein [Symbiobacteriia bacterium]